MMASICAMRILQLFSLLISTREYIQQITLENGKKQTSSKVVFKYKWSLITSFAVWEVWFGLTRLLEMYLAPCNNNAYKISLYTTTHLMISPEPLETPPQKFFYHQTVTETKKFKEFEKTLFEIFMIKVFNRVLLILNKAHIP